MTKFSLRKKIVLASGSVVKEKRSRTPIILVLVLVGLILSFRFTNFAFQQLMSRWYEFFVIIGDMIPPKWEYSQVYGNHY